jgi:hypothetical protein
MQTRGQLSRESPNQAGSGTRFSDPGPEPLTPEPVYVSPTAVPLSPTPGNHRSSPERPARVMPSHSKPADPPSLIDSRLRTPIKRAPPNLIRIFLSIRSSNLRLTPHSVLPEASLPLACSQAQIKRWIRFTPDSNRAYFGGRRARAKFPRTDDFAFVTDPQDRFPPQAISRSASRTDSWPSNRSPRPLPNFR